jgi:squalene-hopene/tetraprenyl-beta-curcumene cyclase
MTPSDSARLRRAYAIAHDTLLAERTPEGHWVGELSTSALSTAVAASALSLVQNAGQGSLDALIHGGLTWLADHQNPDGGWGDTVKSFSNISTTMLCRAAFHLCGEVGRFVETLRKSEAWLTAKYGQTPAELAEAVRQRYGKDRTFSVPILMTSALAGLVQWREVPSLPFELACFPQSWYRWLGLPVVSYALPALIAIGQAVYHHRPPRNPVTRLLRRGVIGSSLRVLTRIQPSNGGFLEAAPLTAFVTMGLASSGKAGHPVVQKAVEFLVNSVRPDGSWPIDTNLSTWVTTLAINALAAAGDLEALDQKESLVQWLLAQQYHERHPYTGAEPGAWAWTPLPGGVPDADDTPGALLAKHQLKAEDNGDVLSGLLWVLNLQNRNGGWPTFCRGWGKLPFDRSGSDLTAHALRAFTAWRAVNERYWRWTQTLEGRGYKYFPSLLPAFDQAVQRGLSYLAREQLPDGSWLPLWFGNQHAPDDINPTYGTAKVLAAYRDMGLLDTEPARRGVAWLFANQNDDGGWGGGKGTPSSIEETALAVEVLVVSNTSPQRERGKDEAVQRGLAWLVERVEAGRLSEATPIGFYFAKLWYFEKLYPIIFTVAALGRACRLLSESAPIGRLPRE